MRVGGSVERGNVGEERGKDWGWGGGGMGEGVGRGSR